MAREGLRRSTRARASVPSSAVATPVAASPASPASEDSSLELLAADDSEDDYVDGGAASAASAASDGDGDADAAEESADEGEADDDSEDDFGAPARAKTPKGKSKATPKGRKAATRTTPNKRKRPPPKKAAPRKPRGMAREIGRRSTAAALSLSTLNTYPDAYRDLLLNSAVGLVKKPDAEVYEKPPVQSFRAPPFPPGPLTPFTSRLEHAPGTAVAEVAATLSSPHDAARREHMRDVAKRVAVIPPWDAWEGEGWWTDLCREGAGENEQGTEGAGKKKGKGKASKAAKVPTPAPDGDGDGPVPGWKWPHQVRLGLDDVGRYSPSDILSESEGKKYLAAGVDIQLDLYDGEETVRHEMAQFDSVHIENTISKGFAFAAGSPAWGLDWAPYPDTLAAQHGFEQYVAVSTIPATQDPTTGSRCDPAVLGAVQIWSVPYVDDENLPSAAPAGARCELVLCFPGGPVMDLKWMPMGAWDDAGAMPKLGIAAVVQLDGSTVLYAVPHPAPLRAVTATQGPIYLKARAVAKFAVDDTASTAIQWLSGRRLAVGLSNGHLAIWDAVDAILAPEPESEPPLPAMYLTLALSSIRSIAAGRTPPTDAAGALDYTGEAVYIAFGSYDGTTGVVDLRDPGNVIELNRSRLPCMATAWSTQVGVPLYADVDYMVLLAQVRAGVGPATYYLAPHRGPVWEIGTSTYHTMVASGASDGALLLSNCGMGFYRRKQGGMLFQRLYELDYDEASAAYRMTHDFVAEASGLEEATSKASHNRSRTKGARAEASAPTAGDPATVKTGAWRAAVGVHRVAWQAGSGLARAGWLASCSKSGIVRVENLRGKWLYQAK